MDRVLVMSSGEHRPCSVDRELIQIHGKVSQKDPYPQCKIGLIENLNAVAFCLTQLKPITTNNLLQIYYFL